MTEEETARNWQKQAIKADYESGKIKPLTCDYCYKKIGFDDPVFIAKTNYTIACSKFCLRQVLGLEKVTVADMQVRLKADDWELDTGL